MLKAQEAAVDPWKIGARGVTALALAVALLASPSPALAGEDHIEPLGSAWKNVIVPKFRGIVSFMDTDYSIKTYRGQGESLDNDLSKYYGTDVITTTPSHLVLSGWTPTGLFPDPGCGGGAPNGHHRRQFPGHQGLQQRAHGDFLHLVPHQARR